MPIDTDLVYLVAAGFIEVDDSGDITRLRPTAQADETPEEPLVVDVEDLDVEGV